MQGDVWERKHECKQITSVYFPLMLSCLVSYTHYNEWLQHLCVTNTKINTEIKWQAEPEDIELHLMPVYLFSFCVSIFYPFYRDTLIFIVHRCHHCLMYTACKQSKRMHESQREFFFKMSNICRNGKFMAGVWNPNPGSQGQVSKKKKKQRSTERNDGVD